VILVDTSAWVEFVRDTGSAACDLVDRHLDGDIATCDAVRMELLAGARSERHLDDLRRILERAEVIPTSPTDYDRAASIYRSCRRQGETPRSLVDCLIAAVAIKARTPVLHADRDFTMIARCSRLESVTG
jgi:hypothetical protein